MNRYMLMTFGTLDGDVQFQAMLQTLLNVHLLGTDPQQAVGAPRFASNSFPGAFEPHACLPGPLNFESGVPLVKRARYCPDSATMWSGRHGEPGLRAAWASLWTNGGQECWPVARTPGAPVMLWDGKAKGGRRLNPDYRVFNAGDVRLQSGATLPGARLAYKTHGALNADKSNAIVYPTRFYGIHDDNAFLIGPGMALDPEKYFIVVPDLTGNGLSSSPSNTPEPFDRMRFPGITILDNVRLQRRLLQEEFGIRRLALAVGWSMGAQQAYHWAALFPDEVERIAPIAGSARTSPHNHVFLEGMKAALTADSAWRDGWYDDQPETGLRAMGRCWAGWALSQTFYREHRYRGMGFLSLEDFLVGFWENLFLKRDANNMLAQIWTWQHSDISDNDTYGRNFERALGAITARAIVMPCESDLYFPPADSRHEVDHMPNAELRIIPSIWGHYAGGAANPDDVAFVDAALRELLSN